MKLHEYFKTFSPWVAFLKFLDKYANVCTHLEGSVGPIIDLDKNNMQTRKTRTHISDNEYYKYAGRHVLLKFVYMGER